jgi:uncharacterized protein
MQHYAIMAWDADGAEQRRLDVRDDHMRHIERVLDRVAIAGPLRDENGGSVGSLLVLKAASVAEATALFESDPYFKVGIWAQWEVHPFLAAAGEWIGGTIW